MEKIEKELQSIYGSGDIPTDVINSCLTRLISEGYLREGKIDVFDPMNLNDLRDYVKRLKGREEFVDMNGILKFDSFCTMNSTITDLKEKTKMIIGRSKTTYPVGSGKGIRSPEEIEARKDDIIERVLNAYIEYNKKKGWNRLLVTFFLLMAIALIVYIFYRSPPY